MLSGLIELVKEDKVEDKTKEMQKKLWFMRLRRVFLESVNKLYGMLVIINVSVDLKSELAAHVNTVSVDEEAEIWNSEILLS